VVALPPLAYLLLGRAQVVGRGRERHGAPDLNEHDGPDLVGNPTLAVEREDLIEEGPRVRTVPMPLKRYPLRETGSTTSISIAGL